MIQYNMSPRRSARSHCCSSNRSSVVQSRTPPATAGLTATDRFSSRRRPLQAAQRRNSCMHPRHTTAWAALARRGTLTVQKLLPAAAACAAAAQARSSCPPAAPGISTVSAVGTPPAPQAPRAPRSTAPDFARPPCRLAEARRHQRRGPRAGPSSALGSACPPGWPSRRSRSRCGPGWRADRPPRRSAAAGGSSCTCTAAPQA